MEKRDTQEERVLLGKIAEVRRKKGGVDPTIIICRDENQPIQIILRSVKPPIITGDYASVSVSDTEFGWILRVFQRLYKEIQEGKVSLSRKFQPSEGGVAYSKMEYYSILEMIERLIRDIYCIEGFFRSKMPAKFKKVKLMENIHEIVFKKWQQNPSILDRRPHTSIFALIDNIEQFSNDEFEQSILPFIEAVLSWKYNKKMGLSTSEFRNAIAKRIRDGDVSAFYGHLTEVYVSGLYIFDGWTPLYVEKLNQDKPEKQFDWVFQKNTTYKIGIECKDQRQRIQEQNVLRLIDVEQKVAEAIAKFSTQQMKSFNLQKRILWINATNVRDYSTPSFTELGTLSWQETKESLAGILTPAFSLHNNTGEIDGVILAWREKTRGDEGLDYIQKYVAIGNIDCGIDLPIVQPLIHVDPGNKFFIRKYTFPEPQWGVWGPEETSEKI